MHFAIRRDLGPKSIGLEDLATVVVLANLSNSHDSHLVLIGVLHIEVVQGRLVFDGEIGLGEVDRHRKIQFCPERNHFDDVLRFIEKFEFLKKLIKPNFLIIYPIIDNLKKFDIPHYWIKQNFLQYYAVVVNFKKFDVVYYCIYPNLLLYPIMLQI